MSKIKTLTVPSGIGDVVWVLQGLEEPANFEICKSQKYRAWQLLDLVPSLCKSYKEGNKRFSYDDPEITQYNSHLEAGKRIEGKIGEWRELPLKTSKYKKEANKLLRKPRGKKLIGVYTSTLRHAWVQHGLAWKPEMWLNFLSQLKAVGVEIALFGAEYDKDMADYLQGKGLEFIDCVGDQHLGVTLEAMKKCEGFIGFPSGLTILAHHINLPTVMFFPHEKRHLKMLNTFNRPGSVEDGTWKGCTFPRLPDLWFWFKNNDVWRELLGYDEV